MRSPVKPFPRSDRSESPGALVALGLLLLGAGLFAACAPSDPVAEVEEARTRYSAEVASFSVDQRPREGALEPPPAGDEATGEAEAGETAAPPVASEAEAGDEAAGEATEPAEPVEVRQDVLLDILLRFDGHDPLPGVTLDITHADADDREKGVYRAYIDTTGVHRGPPAQIVHRLEDVPYVEGDGFHAEVRSPVPAGERDLYRELAEAGEGS